ncbi:MAG: glutathione S-transferase [Planctomycetota bacterium]|jgi:glutathione S-transferase
MLEIFGRRNSSNVIPVMWAVGELNLPHQHHNIGGSFGGDDTAEYLQMNPNGLIPTISDDGFILGESHAILRYLCRQYGQGSLYPDDGQQLALADQWMEWHKFHFMSHLMPAFVNLVRTPADKRNQSVIDQGVSNGAQQLKILDRHLAGKDYILGDSFSIADIPSGALIYKYFNLDIERAALPNIEAWYARLCERPAYQAHAMLPFGSNPEEWLALEQAGA